MNEKIAIQVSHLYKNYAIGIEKDTSLRGFISSAFLKKEKKKQSFEALKDITFSVKKGDVLGIIGKNGAGKSTLLKILSQITKPSKGSIEIQGRIASLLEVGTGFHPELTGRENIYLNGTILGMTRKEVKQKFDEIVSFSGVEKFIDTPVKHYSSGMYVRLAFAVAAHLEPEILIIDEVLAVGDAEFQKKCLGKMKEVAGAGRTVIFVSHDLNAVSTLCNTCLFIENGELKTHGLTENIIPLYLKSIQSTNEQWSNNTPNKDVFIHSAALNLKKKQPNLSIYVTIKLVSKIKMKPSFFAININDELGKCIAQSIPNFGEQIELDQEEKEFEIEVILHDFVPAHYSVSLWIGPHFSETYDWNENIMNFEITQSPQTGRTFPHVREHGFIAPIGHLKALNV